MKRLLSYRIFQKSKPELFLKGITATGSNYIGNADGKKSLPCFSFYPYRAFKGPGFHWSSSLFNQNTFQLEDLFEKSTLKNIQNGSLYWVGETYSVFYGRCFTICYMKVCSIFKNTF